MKRLRNLLFLLIPVFFGSCMDTREELEIKKDGSGTLVMKTDMGKLLEMVKGMGSQNELQKDGLDKPYDTVMLLKDYIDTVKSVPPDQKELLRNAKIHIVMNVQENLGKFDMTFPFSSTDKLQLLYASLNSSTGGLKSMFNGLGKNLPQGPDEPSPDNNMPQITSVYDIVVKDGLYSRKVNQERYNAFVQAIKLDEVKQMGNMFGAMDYTLSVKLPRPVKKVSNGKVTLSDDKKTATLKSDLLETFQHPALLALDIEY